jgi:phytoene synthase
MLDRYGCAPADLAGARLPDGYPALMEAIMGRAEVYFAEGFAGIASLHPSVRPGIRAAARIYREILNEIRCRGYDNLNGRAYTSRIRKIMLIGIDVYARRKRRLLAKAGAPAHPLL